MGWVPPTRHGAAVGLPGQTQGREQEKERESWQERTEAGEALAAGRGSRIVRPQFGRRSVAAVGTVPGPPVQPLLQPALLRWAVNADGLQAVARRRPS